MATNTLRLRDPNGGSHKVVSLGPQAGPSEDVDDGGVGLEVVVAEGLVLGPEEEAEGKTGIVFNVEGNLGKVI